MSLSLFLFLLSLVPAEKALELDLINPTGTYKSDYPQEIRVKLLDNSKIAIAFLFASPSGNIGSGVDTLLYRNNVAIYRTSDDTSCKVTFTFWRNAVKVEHKAADYNWSCGFGHGVIAQGVFDKVSAKTPKIKDPVLQ